MFYLLIGIILCSIVVYIYNLLLEVLENRGVSLTAFLKKKNYYTLNFKDLKNGKF